MLERDQVAFLTSCMEESISSLFEIKKLDTSGKSFLPGFQKGKEAVSGFEVTQTDTNTAYLFVFIKSDENYHLMIFSQNKSKVFAELKQVEVINGDSFFVWKYNPLKRDGKNQARKDYFKENFGSLTMQIAFPNSSSDTETFFNQFFTLCHNRLEADNIA
ncbi:MAG: hypothetical protein Q8934_21885 [Bacillota bacterium]|nr:hypothetical protein [Bacillota bacterium]